jgi:hypothetical protein
MSASDLLEHERIDFRRRAAQRRRQREARLQRLGFADYRVYLNSACWRETRERYWRDPDTRKACGLCGKNPSTLQLHHRTYARVGAEHLDDLVPVCLGCHQLIHALDRRGDLLGLDADLSELVDVRRATSYRHGRRAIPQPEMTDENRRRRTVLVRCRETARETLAKAEKQSKASEEVDRARRRLQRIEGQVDWIDRHPLLVIDKASVDHKIRSRGGRIPPWTKRRIEKEMKDRAARH